jgi:hypothetical protein
VPSSNPENAPHEDKPVRWTVHFLRVLAPKAAAPFLKTAQPGDIVGICYGDTNWRAELAVASMRSANAVNDHNWILENFVPTEPAEIQKMLDDKLDDKDVDEKNQSYYKSR